MGQIYLAARNSLESILDLVLLQNVFHIHQSLAADVRFQITFLNCFSKNICDTVLNLFSNKKIGSVKGELKFLPKKLFGLLFFAWWENTSVYQSRVFLNQEIGNHHAHFFEVTK